MTSKSGKQTIVIHILPNISRSKGNQTMKHVLVITCLGGKFRINCRSAFLKILKLAEYNEGNFRISKNDESDLSQKAPEPNM